MSHTDKMRALLNKIDRKVLNEDVGGKADLSKISTDKLRELVSLQRHYGQKDWGSFESAKRGAMELYKREGQIIELVSPDGEEWTADLDEGYRILPNIDRDRYTNREHEGLEGPINANGRALYYDPREGRYYDPDTDMFLSHEEAQDALATDPIDDDRDFEDDIGMWECGLNEISDELVNRTADARLDAVKSADRSNRDELMSKFDKFRKNQRLSTNRDVRQLKAGKKPDPRASEYQNAEPGRRNFGDSVECHDEKLDELSPKTLGSYARQAGRSAANWGHETAARQGLFRGSDSDTPNPHIERAARKAKNRGKGIERAADRLALGYPGEHEKWDQPNYGEQLDELSKDTLKSYVKKAADDTWYQGRKFQQSKDAGDQGGKRDANRRDWNHRQGIDRAMDRLEEATTDNIETLQNIVADHQATKVKFGDGTSMMVDVQTADVILKVYEAVNPDNQAKLNRMVNKDRASFMRVVDFCWSKVGFQEDTLSNEHDQVMAEMEDAMNNRGSEC